MNLNHRARSGIEEDFENIEEDLNKENNVALNVSLLPESEIKMDWVDDVIAVSVIHPIRIKTKSEEDSAAVAVAVTNDAYTMWTLISEHMDDFRIETCGVFHGS